ncbi:hypothetical protein EBZ80_21060 [bacterium]|nr:hypothetical protein [bacterium]
MSSGQQVKTPRGTQRQQAQQQPSPLTRLAMSYMQARPQTSRSVPTQDQGWRLLAPRLDVHKPELDKWAKYEQVEKQWKQSTGPEVSLCAWVHQELVALVDKMLENLIDARRFRQFETFTQQVRALAQHYRTKMDRSPAEEMLAKQLTAVVEPATAVLYDEDLVMDRDPDFLDAPAVRTAFLRAQRKLAKLSCDPQQGQKQQRGGAAVS